MHSISRFLQKSQYDIGKKDLDKKIEDVENNIPDVGVLVDT